MTSEPTRPVVGPQFIEPRGGDAASSSDGAGSQALGFRVSSIVLWQLFGRLSEAAGYENILNQNWNSGRLPNNFLVVVLAPLRRTSVPLQARFRPARHTFGGGGRNFCRSKRHSLLVDSPLAVIAGVTAFISDLRRSRDLVGEEPCAVIYIVTLIWADSHRQLR